MSMILSDQRRSLFAVAANDYITAHYVTEAQLDMCDPSEDFPTIRKAFDLKNDKLYELFLRGKTRPQNAAVELNLIHALHQNHLFVDFLKYLDQLFVDKSKETKPEVKNSLRKSFKIAFTILQDFMSALFFTNENEYIDGKINLIKTTLAGGRGDKASSYFEDMRSSYLESMDSTLLDDIPEPIHQPRNQQGLKIYEEAN
jgi:hypothetical protein